MLYILVAIFSMSSLCPGLNLSIPGKLGQINAVNVWSISAAGRTYMVSFRNSARDSISTCIILSHNSRVARFNRPYMTTGSSAELQTPPPTLHLVKYYHLPFTYFLPLRQLHNSVLFCKIKYCTGRIIASSDGFKCVHTPTL